MMFNFLLVAGVAVLSAGLRTFDHPAVFRLGNIGVIVTSFLAGWLLGESVVLGCVLAASWLFLPWLEILTRIRHLRLPAERVLRRTSPPSREIFPNFSQVTDEVEGEGFEYVEDIGWEHDGHRHFYRVFQNEARTLQATIAVSEQQEMAFFYISLTSRTSGGRTITTWNYPFAYGLQLQPHLTIHRFNSQGPFVRMMAAHDELLRRERVAESDLVAIDSESLPAQMEKDLGAQISHNLSVGLLQQDQDSRIRYTVRGMFFLWFQFLRDFVRLS